MLANWCPTCLIFNVLRFILVSRKMLDLVHYIVGDTLVKVERIKFNCDFVRLVESEG